MRTAALLALPMLLLGCATSPVSDAEARHVTGESILAPSMIQPRPATTPVTIKRDTGLNTGMCSTRFFVNGAPVADVGTGEKVVVYLPQGDHIFSARPNGICSGGTPELKTSVRLGVPLSIRAGYGSAGEFYLNVTAF